MFVDLDGPLNASSLLSASAELLVYRALACNACWTQYCLTNSVRLSVCPMPRSWHIVMLFDGLVGASFYCFGPGYRRYNIPRTAPLVEGVKCTEGRKFSKYCHLSRKRYEIGRLWLPWNTNRKSWVAGRSVSDSVPMTLNDLEGRGLRINIQYFLADLHNYARMVWPRMTEFGTVTQVREKHISITRLHLKGRAERP